MFSLLLLASGFPATYLSAGMALLECPAISPASSSILGIGAIFDLGPFRTGASIGCVLFGKTSFDAFGERSHETGLLPSVGGIILYPIALGGSPHTLLCGAEIAGFFPVDSPAARIGKAAGVCNLVVGFDLELGRWNLAASVKPGLFALSERGLGTIADGTPGYQAGLSLGMRL